MTVHSAQSDHRYRLKQLVIYVCQRMRAAESFGSTKLNKALFNAEAASVRKFGRPLTFFTYQKNFYGPTLRAYLPLIRELQEEGAIEVRTSGLDEERFEACIEADRSAFSDQELALVDQEVDLLLPLSAREASDRSHETAGWWATRLGETIPWALAFVAGPEQQAPLTAEEEDRAGAAIEIFLRRAGA
jgi:Antitoxin SocA-like, Panacea domain